MTALAAPSLDPLAVDGKTCGLAIGLLSPKARGVIGLGTTHLAQATPPSGSTVFEIGSVTKVLTGFLLARSLERGEHRLDESIETYFPRGTPTYEGQSITLLDLATHTSGLPEMPTNLHSRPPNPASGYTAADLANFLASYQLKGPVGQTYLYSNSGSGTLAYILGLATSSGVSDYAEVLRRELSAPLGLLDTTLVLSPSQAARSAQGYASGLPAPVNDIGPALIGAGAVRSTADDLLRLLDAALGNGPPEAVATWKTVLEARRPLPSGHVGLLINRDETQAQVVYAKSGGTAGFSSQIAFTTTPPAAVVLLANTTHTRELYPLALAILAELHALE